ESGLNFASVGEDIRYGLGAVRNVGSNVVASLINTRTDKGKFIDFSDYLNKIDIGACNKKVTESLIKAGAFDSLDHPRKGLFLVHTDAVNDAQVIVGGILASVNRRVNKNGLPWASAQLEDLTGGIEVLFFPQTYSTFGAEIADDAVVLVGAKVAIRDDRISLIANDLVVPDFSSAQANRPLAVSLPTRQCTVDKVSALKQVLARHPGTSQVHLRLISGERITTLELDA